MSMSHRPSVEPEPTHQDSRPTAPAGGEATSRRAFVRTVGLGAAALGAAAATGGTLTGTAGAQTAGSSTPPDLSSGDVALLQFLQSITLAGEQTLATAAKSPLLASTIAETTRGFSRNHRDQAVAIGALLSKDNVIAEPNPTLLAGALAQIEAATVERQLLTVMATLEEQLAATMLAAMGEAQSFLVAGPVAAVLAVVGQQAATFGDAAGEPIDEWIPTFASTDGALSPGAYPVG